MTQTTVKPRDESAPSLAVTLLLVGLAYALPIHLFPVDHPATNTFAKGILNLYCMVGWMGLAHFIYAYRGQLTAIGQKRVSGPKYLMALVMGGLILLFIRHWVGWLLFSFLMWIYFIPHFVHALVHFRQAGQPQEVALSKGVYWFPTLSFAVFTFALFGLPLLPLGVQSWSIIGIVAVVLLLGCWGKVYRELSVSTNSSVMLLAFFLLGEALVWGSYSPFMHPHFRTGLYVVHVAAASFYHYFRSYNFAQRVGSHDPWVSPKSIVGINLAMVAVGYTVMQLPTLKGFGLLFDVSWFTFWVGLHQYASDVFNALKVRRSL